MLRRVAVLWMGLGIVMGLAGAWGLQEKGEEPMGPPPPLEDEYLDRMEGKWEWKGKSYLPNGESAEFVAHDSYEWVLGRQFLLQRYRMEIGGQQVFEGLALITKDRAGGEYKSWWFDVNRIMDASSGKRDGDTLKMTSEGPMGKNKMTIVMPEEGEASSLYERQWPGMDEYMKFIECTGKRAE